MGHHRQRRIFAASCAVLGLVSIASAQVADGGKTLRLTLGQTLEYSDNFDLLAEPDGNTLRSSTRLGLSYNDVTRIQTLRFSMGGFYDVDGDESDIRDPFAVLTYALKGANSRLSFAVDYRQTDIDDALVPFLFLGPNDELVSDTVLFEGGTRTTTNYDFGFETGLQSSVGFKLDLSSEDRRYSDTDLTTLAPTTLREVEALTTFRINPSTTARLIAQVRNYETGELETTERFETAFGVGVAVDVTPALSFDVSATLQEITREVNGLTARETDGLAVMAHLTRALPNGLIELDASSQPTLSGRDDVLRVRREMALRRGATLSYGLGLSKTGDFSTEPLVSFSYTQQMRRGTFEITLDQNSRVDETDDEAVILTRLAANYSTPLTPRLSWSIRAGVNDVAVRAEGEDRRRIDVNSDFTGQINDVSSWSLGATLSDVRSAERQRRYGVRMSYRREITRAWDLVASYQHNTILDSNADDRRSNLISFGLERAFDIRF